MELRQLKYFKTAYELQNFSEAARNLYISQSTLSQQIKQLESELDILLFDRIGKRIVPTEAGKAFFPYASKALCDTENGKQIIMDLKGIETGYLNIGVTYSLGHLLTKALKIFSDKYPRIKIKITFSTSEDLLGLLGENRLDFALSFLPEGIKDRFETIPLFSSQLYFIVHKSHELSDLTSITIKRLSQTPLILPEKGFTTRTKVEELCMKSGTQLNVCVEVNDVQTIINTLKDSIWGTVLTKAAIRDENELRMIPIVSGERLVSQGYLLWPEGCYRKKSAQAFAETISDIVTGKR